jgi:Phospholipase_D-nuclease N-terminal
MRKQKKKRWSDLSREKRAGIAGVGVVQVGLLIAALVDIVRRPADQIKGSKPLWAAASFINFVGPLAYFRFGRKR